MTIEIHYDDLARHADHIETSATDVGLAADATSTVSDEAFGILCSFLPPILNAFWPTNQGAIQSASSTLSGVHDSLHSIIEHFSEADWDAQRASEMIEDAVR